MPGAPPSIPEPAQASRPHVQDTSFGDDHHNGGWLATPGCCLPGIHGQPAMVDRWQRSQSQCETLFPDSLNLRVDACKLFLVLHKV